MATIVLPPGSSTSQGSHELDASLARYVRDSLRLRAGTEVRFTDGAGVVGRAVLAAVDRKVVILEILESKKVRASPAPEVWLIQALGKGEKNDGITRQVTELGVSRLSMVTTERTVPRHVSRQERWSTIADDAIRVSGRAVRPRIDEVSTLEERLAEVRPEGGLRVCFDGHSKLGLRDLSEILSQRLPVVELLVGPEGGFSSRELDAAKASGFLLVHLGSHTFRMETAAPAAAAMVLCLAGRFDRGDVESGEATDV